jgi:hypothetical protein
MTATTSRRQSTNVFDAPGRQIDDVYEYVNEVVYPKRNVLNADVMVAALMIESTTSTGWNPCWVFGATSERRFQTTLMWSPSGK